MVEVSGEFPQEKPVSNRQLEERPELKNTELDRTISGIRETPAQESLPRVDTSISSAPNRNSPAGSSPYPSMPPLCTGKIDDTPIVTGQDFKAEDFNLQSYFHGKGMGSNYGLLRHGYDAYDNDNFWNPVIKTLQKFVKPEQGSRILEVGCATGYFIKRLQKAGYGETIGCDISTTVLEEAKRNVPEAQFEEFNLNSDLFNPALAGTFDAIAAFDVLEHTAHRIEPDGREVSGPEHVIPKLAALLKQGGIFIMSAPVADRNLFSWFFNLFDSDKSHVSKLPSKKYLEILETNGFEILEKHHAFLLPWIRIPFLPTAIEIVGRKK